MFIDEKIIITEIVTIIAEEKSPTQTPIIHYSKKNRNACDLVYLLEGSSITHFDNEEIRRNENTVMFLNLPVH